MCRFTNPPVAFEEGVAQLPLGGLGSVFDLGDLLRLDPDAPMGQPKPARVGCAPAPIAFWRKSGHRPAKFLRQLLFQHEGGLGDALGREVRRAEELGEHRSVAMSSFAVGQPSACALTVPRIENANSKQIWRV